LTLHPAQMAAQDAALYSFLQAHDHGSNAREALTTALRNLCQAGGGIWMQPDQGQGGTIRHTTHLHEISAHGITATGMGADQAVLNWRKLAYQHLSATLFAPMTRQPQAVAQ
jgi:hypothetical protein